MKKAIFISTLCILFNFLLVAQQDNENYYYYQKEKIFLQQSTNRIFLKFVQNADKEQIRSLINSDRSLQLTPEMSIDDNVLDFAILETKDDNEILSSAIIESLKTHPVTVSVTPVFLYNKVSQGLTDEFVVKLKPTTSYNQLQVLAEQNNCLIKEENQFVKNQFMINVSKNGNLNAMEMSRLFFETGFFEFSEPNFIVFNAFNSNDTYFNQQWALKNIGQNGGTSGIDIKIEQAWTIATGANIKVAVVDMGIDLTHPDLQANIILPGYEHPASGNNNGAAVTSYDVHGTPCAGIIGAIKDNDKGTAGVAPDCKIKPARISTYNGGLNTDWAAGAINWAWQNGADIISNSWGGGSPYQPVTDAINNAVSQGRDGKGCIVVFASGNNYANSVSYPASLPNVIAVGAINRDGNKADFSNYGVALDVVAPGVDIPTTDRQGNVGYNYVTNNTYDPAYSDYTNKDYTGKFGGTSAACPHVAGVAALMLSVEPNLTGQKVRDIIESTAQKIRTDLYAYSSNSSHPNGTWNNQVGYGLIDAYAAVQATCGVTTVKDHTIDQDTTVTSCGDINVEDVTVESGAKLELKAPGVITIKGEFKIESGSEFEITR